ncbi:MAG TPA: hypothetical protein VFD27_16480, partial [Chthoniobacteraceae bacterium]|nr:hypothetical protein [Chthoniobacteraceae bacterium]
MTRQNRILRAGVARAIIPTSLLLALSATAFSGPEVKAETKHEKKIEKPLLSFADGLVQFDVETRARFEIRNNTRDFDDAINDDNDDSWLLTRFRLGLALKPLPWLKLYAQTQDVREIDSDRPNIPGVRGTEGFDEFDLRQADRGCPVADRPGGGHQPVGGGPDAGDRRVDRPDRDPSRSGHGP